MSVPSITGFTSTTITVAWTGAASSIVVREGRVNNGSLTTVGTYVVTSDITRYSVTYNTKANYFYSVTVNFLSGTSSVSPVTQYLASSGSTQGYSSVSNDINMGNSELIPEIREEFGMVPASTNRWTFTNANTSANPTVGDAALFVDGNSTTSPYMVMSLDPFNSGTETSIESTNSLRMPFDVAVAVSTSQRHEAQVMSVEAVSTDREPGLPTTQSVTDTRNIITHFQYNGTTVTVFTSVPHGLVPGQIVSIHGLLDSRCNIPGVTVASIPQPTQFTFTAGALGNIIPLALSATGLTGSGGNTSTASYSNAFVLTQPVYVTAGTVSGSLSAGAYTVLSGGGGTVNATSTPIFAPNTIQNAAGMTVNAIVAVPPPTEYTFSSTSTNGIQTVTTGTPHNILNLTATHGLAPGMTVALTTSGALATNGISGTNIYNVFSLPASYPQTSVMLTPNPPTGNFTGTLSIVNAATITGVTNTSPISTTGATAAVTGSIVIPTIVSATTYSVTGFTPGSAPLTMNTTSGLAIGMPIQFSTAIGGFSVGITYFIQAVTGSTISLSTSLGGGAQNTSGASAASAISLAYAVNSFTNGSAPLTMNSTAGLAVGMPIRLGTSLGGSLAAATTLFIQAVAAGTISLATTSIAAASVTGVASTTSTVTIQYTSQNNLAITSTAGGVITTSANHGLVVGNQVIFSAPYGGYLARYPYFVTATSLAVNTFTLTTAPGVAALTSQSGGALAAGGFTANCSATCTTSAISGIGVVTLTAPANVMATNAQVTFGAALGGQVIGYPHYISGAPTVATSITLSQFPAGAQGQLTLSTSATIPSVPGQTVYYGNGRNSFPVGAMVNIYGSSPLAGKQYYIVNGTGTQTLIIVPVSATDFIPALSGLNDTLIIVPSGSFTRFDHISNRRNGSSMLLTSSSQTNAQFADRYESSMGLATVSGTTTGAQTVTITTTFSASAISATTVGTYSGVPSSQYHYSQQVEGITWSDMGVDNAGTVPSIRFKRNQNTPNPQRSYNLRFKAMNFQQISRPNAVITSAVKSGASLAIVTTETPHGLTMLDVVQLYGISDQTNFPNTTSAGSPIAILSPTTFSMLIGTGTSGMGFGGFVQRAQGNRGVAGIQNVAITGISKSLNIITITTNVALPTIPATGDYVNLFGIRAVGTGGLPVVNGVGVSFDGIYRYVGQIATAIYAFDTIADIYGNNRSPVAALASSPDFTNIAVGGAYMRRTDYRLHYVRANERKRLILEQNQNRPDQSLAMPVSLTNASTVTVSGAVGVSGGVNAAVPIQINDVASAGATFNASGAGVTTSVTISAASGISNTITVLVTALTLGTTASTFGIPYNCNANTTLMDVGVDESDDGGTNWYRVYDFPRISSIGIYRSPKLLLNGTRLRYVSVGIGGTSAALTRTINRLSTSHNDSVSTITTKIPNAIQEYTSATTAGLTTIVVPTFNSISNISTYAPYPIPSYTLPSQVSFGYNVGTYTGATSLTVAVQESYDNGLNWVVFYTFPTITAVGIYTSPKLAYNGNILRYVETVGGTFTGFNRAMTRFEYIDNSNITATLPLSIVDVQSGTFVSPNERATIVPVTSGTSCQLSVPVTVITPSSGYDLRVEESDDAGLSWNRLYDFPRITNLTSTTISNQNNTGQYRSPKLAISGSRLRYVQSVIPSQFTVGTGTVTVTASALVTSTVQNPGRYTVSACSQASPTVLTLNTTQGLAVGLPIQFNAPIATTTAIAVGTTYYIASIPSNTTLTLVSGNASGGTAINHTGTAITGLTVGVTIPYISQVITTVSATTSAITTSGNHNLVAGNQIIFTSTAFGLTVGTFYYVLSTGLTPTSFGISTTSGPGGSAVSLSSGSAVVTAIANCTAPVTATTLPSTTTITLSAPSNFLIANMPIIFAANLGNIVGGTLYYVNGQPTSATTISIGTANTITRSIIRHQTLDDVPTFRQLIEKATNPASGSSISLTTVDSTTQAVASQNARSAQLTVGIGGAGTAPVVRLEGSDDFGSSWYGIGTAVTAPTAGGSAQETYTIHSGHIRARVTTAAVSLTTLAGSGNYVAIKILG